MLLGAQFIWGPINAVSAIATKIGAQPDPYSQARRIIYVIFRKEFTASPKIFFSVWVWSFFVWQAARHNVCNKWEENCFPPRRLPNKRILNKSKFWYQTIQCSLYVFIAFINCICKVPKFYGLAYSIRLLSEQQQVQKCTIIISGDWQPVSIL